MKSLTHLDMALNSILRLVLEPLAADPATPTAGRIYYNTATNEPKWADGTQWNTLATAPTGSDILTALMGMAGAGSGLDADTVDGLEASAFALAAHTHTAAQIDDFAAAVDARIMAAFTNEAVDATVDTIAEFTQLIRDNQAAITAVLSAKRHDELFGDGVATSFTINHALNTTVPIVQVVEEATGETVLARVARPGANAVQIDVDIAAPAAGEYRAIVLG